MRRRDLASGGALLSGHPRLPEAPREPVELGDRQAVGDVHALPGTPTAVGDSRCALRFRPGVLTRA